MLSLSAKIRNTLKKKNRSLREKGRVPAVLYGPEIKSLNLTVDLKEFKEIFEKVGETSLISLEVEGEKKKFPVLVQDIQLDPLSGEPIHLDFYRPLMKEKTEVEVPIVIEGQAPAVKELDGTLVKNISELEVKALPQNLPNEIKVNVEGLKELGDHILVKDLRIPEGVEVLREPEEIVISVSSPEEIPEEEVPPLEKEIPLGEEAPLKEEPLAEEKIEKKEPEKKPPEEG